MIQLTGVNGQKETIGAVHIRVDAIESVYIFSDGMTLVQPRSGAKPHCVGETVDEVLEKMKKSHYK